jgi:hypothetical protein
VKKLMEMKAMSATVDPVHLKVLGRGLKTAVAYELLWLQLSNLLMWCFLSPPVANFVSNVVSAVIPAINALMVNIVPLADLDGR